MSYRDHVFAIDEHYHCFNRGTEKRVIFSDTHDYDYFIKSLEAYNAFQALGKLRLYNTKKHGEKLVEVLSYSLLPNHYHLVLKENTEHGISNFMKRVGVGYTMYFNQKYERNGVLFQGKFKSKHVSTDQDLRQVLAYVHYNHVIHSISNPKLYRNWLNPHSEIPRDQTSHLSVSTNMLEIVDIINKLRLSFD